MITLASLFDGISGFPLAGQRNGIVSLWASEIEPFPMKVSAVRFPEMVQHGDITKINGAEVEPVDIITGGSPCQDLSVAGKRAGLAGERSGLFMEQIRIVREMRNADKLRLANAVGSDMGERGATNIEKSITQHRFCSTNKYIRPRFMVWENVPGAFSSNKGEDFRAVLEETARIADETIVIPGPPKGKWNTVGAIMGNGWSIAWRVLDAQYWGVPQRRRRIFLVADFGGQSAPEVLLKREGLSRHLKESGEEREGITADAERGIGAASWDCRGNGDGKTASTLTGDHQNRATDYTTICIQGSMIGRADKNGPQGDGINEDASFTLNATDRHAVCAGFCYKAAAAAGSVGYEQEKAPTLKAQQQMAVINCQPSGIAGTVSSKWAKGTGGPAGDEHYNLVTLPIPINTMCCQGRPSDNGRLGSGIGNPGEPANTLSKAHSHGVATGYSVRRLTPLETDRLQDYPELAELEVDKMTKDEWIAFNLANDNIRVDAENGEVYAMRKPGGIRSNTPIKLKGCILPSGYRVITIRINEIKFLCRVNRVVWIAVNGIPPEGYVVDHKDNNKLNNAISNLQLLTAHENSTKAAEDGLYLSGDESPVSKLPESKRTEITELYKTGDYTIRQLAEIYGISKSRIHQIIHTSSWTDIPGASDSARYKADGNSIAVCCAEYVLEGIKEVLDR